MRALPHVAVRSCVGCGGRDDQSHMVRLVRAVGGRLEVDFTRTRPGRGAYLHRVEACLASFAKRRGMVRSLRAPVDMPTRRSIVEELRGGASE